MPGALFQAAIRELLPALPVPGRFVSDILVTLVQEPLLFEDPGQAVFMLCFSRSVPTSCCSFELGSATRQLVTESFAEVFEVGEGADLKSCGGI